MKMLKHELSANQWAATIGLAILVLLSSCAVQRADLLADKRVTLEIIPSATHTISQPSLYQDGKEFVVYGKLELTSGFCRLAPWVDIAILAPDGTLLQTASMPYVPRGGKQHGWYGASFRARLPLTIPNGSKVRLAANAPECHNGDTFQVTENLAVPKQ